MWIILRTAPYAWLGYGAWVDDPRAAMSIPNEDRAKMIAREWNREVDDRANLLFVAMERAA